MLELFECPLIEHAPASAGGAHGIARMLHWLRRCRISPVHDHAVERAFVPRQADHLIAVVVYQQVRRPSDQTVARQCEGIGGGCRNAVGQVHRSRRCPQGGRRVGDCKGCHLARSHGRCVHRHHHEISGMGAADGHIFQRQFGTAKVGHKECPHLGAAHRDASEVRTICGRGCGVADHDGLSVHAQHCHPRNLKFQIQVATAFRHCEPTAAHRAGETSRIHRKFIRGEAVNHSSRGIDNFP